MNKQTLTYELKIKAIIDSAQKDLAGFGQAMNQAWANGEPPKSLLKAMESMRQRLGSLSEIAQKGVVDSSDLAQAEDDYKAFTKTLHSLTVEFGLFTAEQKKAMLSPEEQKAIQGRAEALRKYNEELKRSNDILEKRKPLEEDQKTQSEKVKNLTKKKEDDKSAYKALKEQGGPKFSKESQVYIDNQKRILELNEKIKKAQDKVSDGEALGKLGEGKNNEWTRAAESLERYQKELAEIDSEAGKAFYDKELKEYNESLNKLEKNIGFTSTALDEAKKELSGTEEQLKKLKASDPKELFNNLIKQLKDLGVEGIDGATTFEELEKAVTKLNSKALTKVDDALATAKQELLKMGQAAKEAKRGIDESTAAIKQQEAAIAEREAFEGKIKQFLGLAGAVEVMKNAFRNAFATIKELDATMGEMAVVTDLTVGDYWNQLPEYAKRASELGVSINGAYEAATLYYQQGLKTNEVIAISTETLKMARIAGLSAEDATQKMTAALRGFNMELNETSAQRISDVYSELAAITAADVEQISNAMSKTASIASSAGMEFETTAAFLSQIIETTQESAETAGTAMKTVIARFQELKKDPAEIGEVDGEMVDANKIEAALRSVGVALRDTSGQFRDLDDVFLELASKWKTFDKNTQRYIATIAAGSRQQSRFLAMMSDYERTQELVTAANDSAGASNKQFEKTLDTLETKLKKLKNAWDEFAMGILNSDLVKVGVDILTKFLEIVNKATSSFKGLGGSIVKILSVITMFKLGQKIFDKFKQPLFKFFSDLTKMGYQAGYDAGKAYADGVKKAKQESNTNNSAEDLQSQSDNIIASNQKQSLGSKILNKTGLSTIYNSGKDLQDTDKKALVKEWEEMVYGTNKPITPFGRTKAIDQAKQQRIDRVQAAEKTLELEKQKNKKIEYTTKKGTKVSYTKNKKGVANAERELEAARKDLVEFDETQKQVQKNGQEGWEKMGQGISKLGGSVMAVGIAVSALGGIFDALGMEEVGETFATVGSIMTLLGGAISAIGTLVPIVTKILVASGYSVQSAWWPLLVIGLALAALIGTVLLIVEGIKAAEAAKLENRMKAAAEATEEAKQAAQEARQAYEDLFDNWDKYKDTQNSLEKLTKNTTDWRQALYKANQEVLELIEKYPELQKWVRRTNEGELLIADEGWEELKEKQLEIMNNTNSDVMSKTMTELDLRIEEIETAISDGGIKKTVQESTKDMDYGEKNTLIGTGWTDKGEYLEKQVIDPEFTKQIQQQFRDYFVVEEQSLEKALELAAEMAEGYGTNAPTLGKMVRQIYDSLIETTSLQEQRAIVAETYLSQIASNTVKDSEHYDNIVGFYSNYVASDTHKQTIKEQAASVGQNSADDNLAQHEFYGKLIEDYEVSDAGNNMANMKALYKKMTGKTDEDIKDMTNEDLIKAVTEIGYNNQLSDNMTELAQTLANIKNTTSRTEIGALLGDEGKGLTKGMIGTLYNDGNMALRIDEKQVKAYFEKAGLSFTEVAKTMGITEEALMKQIEANTKKSYKIQVSAMERLNTARKKHLGDEYSEQEKFSNLSISQTAAIANKLTNILATSGEDLSDEFEAISLVLEDKADMFTAYISSINWSDLDIKDKIKTELEGMGIAWTPQIEEFIDQAFKAGKAISVIDFETLNQDLQTVYDLLKQLQSGEQGREFEEKDYERLIKADGSLTKDFAQIGDKFVYVGSSIDRLIDALNKNTYNIVEQSKYQYEQQSKMSTKLATDGTITVGNKSLLVQSTASGDLERDEQIVYLQGIRDMLLEEVSEGNITEEALSFITGTDGSGLGLSFTTDFTELSDGVLASAVDSFQKLVLQNTEYLTKYAEAQRNSLIQSYVETNSAKYNAEQARALGYKSTQGKEYVEALIAQAVQSGEIPEAVIESYTEAIEKNNSGEIAKYEARIVDGITKAVKNQEQLQQLVDLQNQVVEMLYNERQKEIDKLNTINDSINDANAQLLSKIQEQINEARQERENSKTEQNIADLESQRAYLLAAGSDATQVATLDKQITESQIAYQDTLIDQELDKLQDANEKAAEQRERQISIAEAQLELDKDSSVLAQEAQQIVKDSLTKINAGTDPINTSIGKLFAKEGNWDKLTTEQLELERSNFKTLITNAANIANALGVTGVTKDEKGEDKKVSTKTGAKVAGKLGNTINETNQKNKQIQNDSAKIAADIVQSRAYKGDTWETTKASTAYQDAKSDYVRAGGLASEFDSAVSEQMNGKITAGLVGKLSSDGFIAWEGKNSGWKKGTIQYDGTKYDICFSFGQHWAVPEGTATTLNENFGEVDGGTIVMYDNKLFAKWGGMWQGVVLSSDKQKKRAENATKLRDEFKTKVNAYKTGGLADFTGPAWLDGTKAHPELVLNARDTQNFIQLKDILADILDGTNHTTNNSQNKQNTVNTIDIDINVESIGDDYDVEQLADKIRSMLYDDATYRNVNTISLSH